MTTVARIQASQTQAQEETLRCQSEKSPPDQCPRNQSVAQSALAQSPTPDLDSQSDVGEPDSSAIAAGAEP
ncbi:MAG: hypothetical protein HC769_35915 [Cyanobacteria bacterium CRU_2_1]|nr:hypothetical protein [Cyanobacteria bacterium CRU_2_1]